MVCWWNSRWFWYWLLNYCHTITTGACWPPKTTLLYLLATCCRGVLEKFSFSYLISPSLFLSLPFFFFFLKTFILVQNSSGSFISSSPNPTRTSSCEQYSGNLQAGPALELPVSFWQGSTHGFDAVINGWMVRREFTVLYQLLERLLVLRKFSLLQGSSFVRVVTRKLLHVRRMANRIQHRRHLSTWAYCFRTIFFGLSNSTFLFWNNVEMRV